MTQSQPQAVRSVSIPFELLCDPKREVYRYFGLERGGLLMFFHPRVLAHYLRLVFSGWWPNRPEVGEDLYQLGGDFVISADRRLLFAYRSHDPADRPSVGEIIKHLTIPA